MTSFPEIRHWGPWRRCLAEALGATRGQQRPALAGVALSPVDCRLGAAVLTQSLNCWWPRIARGCSSRGYSFPGFRKTLTSSLSFHNPPPGALFPSSTKQVLSWLVRRQLRDTHFLQTACEMLAWALGLRKNKPPNRSYPQATLSQKYITKVHSVNYNNIYRYEI